jgi:hypothetical protein
LNHPRLGKMVSRFWLDADGYITQAESTPESMIGEPKYAQFDWYEYFEAEPENMHDAAMAPAWKLDRRQGKAVYVPRTTVPPETKEQELERRVAELENR